MRVERVEFPAEDGVVLRGLLHIPDQGPGPFAAVSMAHGFGGTIYNGLQRYAELFTRSGLMVLVHDHRGFGYSDGQPRRDIDPWRQIADWRWAISYLETHPDVDAERIGVWGSSYAGGHVLVLGASDRRIKCVVAQVPTISGVEQGRRRITSAQDEDLLTQSFTASDRAQYAGDGPTYTTLFGTEPPALYRTADTVAFADRTYPDGYWENSVTTRSTRAARLYEPGRVIAGVSPTPLLIVVAEYDTVTPADLALGAYEQARDPKHLVEVACHHFEIYDPPYFEQSGPAALDWFQTHLAAYEGEHCDD